MAFLPPTSLVIPKPTKSASHPRRRPRPPRLALSEPVRPTPSPHPSESIPWPQSRPSQPSESDYGGWSRDFIDLCDAQLHLLTSSVSNISQVLLFFRRENPSTGALEFVPLVVHTRGVDDRARRVWISAPGSAHNTELEEAVQPSHVLPGGIPAEWILPDYPFKSVGEQGGILMPDGGLCIPVEYNGVLAGSVVLCPETPPTPGHPGLAWDPEDIKRADMVAKSIALGAALEGKWAASAGMLGTGRSLIDSMRQLLRTTLHQLRSPVSALVTFGHLLLRRLPPGDSNRALAKNIILEALRLDDLLKPLDDASDRHVLPEAVDGAGPWYGREEEGEQGLDFIRQLGAKTDYSISKPTNFTKQVSTNGLQLLWLSDVLVPQVEIARVLAEEKQMIFHAMIDDDTPAVLAVEKYVREAVSNLVDNSLKYSPAGSQIGIVCASIDNDDNDVESEMDTVEVIVWDTGYGFSDHEREEIWKLGFRGSASVLSGSAGSGIGLSTVKEMLSACGAEISLQSPLPAHLDPRTSKSPGAQSTPGSAFFLQFKRPMR